jgi:DNA-binding response OmpR family regulator
MAQILVIDDDADLRDVIMRILKAAGHSVVTAPDGEAGLRTFNEHRFDMVVTDIVMPKREGLEVIREMRQARADLKILAVSGAGILSRADYLPYAERLGADRVLAKPFMPQDLVGAVKELLGAA